MTTERGQAGILIELKNGNITVTHSTDHVVLAELKNAPEGTWNALWERLVSLGFERFYE